MMDKHKRKISRLLCVIFAVFWVSLSMAQTKMISGTVTDENGEPIIGASIRIKNSQMGTVSGIDGNFSLEVSPEDILVISYVGYKTQEIKVGEQTKLTIRLVEDVKMIDELVVVGYGILWLDMVYREKVI